ncbi:EthD family reductase [Paracoccus methylovorus]|uniref:EthD family reductase n=1 Tax=Paracoccus methylovorus TaxID=2812658 RepID=A0ABX7JR71_9RHOB|nr:EthD family reductase [Paracoccus methylovorus]QRZ15147.1 EthD family reductase [Paracoccus methylovorus]
MITRSAFLLGRVAPEDQPAFDRHMRETVVAEILTYPGIRRVTLRKLAQADAGAEADAAYMQFDLFFDSHAAMDAALASPVRQAVQERIKAGMGPFAGRVIHVVSDMLEDRA